MAKIVVSKIIKEDKTNKGTKFWECLGTIDGELESFKVWDEPQLGVEFDGEVKDNDKYGKSVSTGRGGGGGGGGRRYERDPEIGNQIMRQNALEHATAIILKVAELEHSSARDTEAGLKKAKEILSPVNVIKVADWFFRYSNGTIGTAATAKAPAATSAPAAQVPITKEAVTEAFPETADQQDDPTPPKGKDVPVEDLPF